ncbi:MAG: sensor histidine kinase [bacterium]|nr:sensor histidine kinase [bacterium]
MPLIWLILILWASPLAASELPTLDQVPLGPYLELAEDAGADWDLKAAQDAYVAGAFKPSTGAQPNFGYGPQAIWARLELGNSTDRVQRRLLELDNHYLNQYTLWQINPEGLVETQLGDHLPFAQRPVLYRNFLVPLDFKPGEQKILWARIASNSRLRISFNLWKLPPFGALLQREYLAFGLYFGLIAVMVCYNLFLYGAVGDRAYLWYSAYIASFGLASAGISGLSYQYLWPQSLWWNERAIFVAMEATELCLVLFTRRFLFTAQDLPRWDRVLLAYAVFNGLSALLPLLPSDYWSPTFFLITCFPSSLLCIATAVYRYRRGYRPARYFLLAFVLFFSGVLLFISGSLGLFDDGPLVRGFIYIGSALEVVLLAFSLADRINLLRQEKDLAQGEVVALMERQTEELETLVAERTQDLADSNRQLQRLDEEKSQFLSIAAHDLKTPLVGVNSFAALLQTQLPPEMAECREYVDYIRRSSAEMGALISSLLDLARIEDQVQREPGFVAVAIEHQVAAAVERIKPQCQLAGVGIEVVGLVPEQTWYGRPEWVGEVLGNLLSNGLKFAPLGSQLKITVQSKGPMLRLAVIDQGPGVPPEKVAHLFERFSTPGGGLGLYIVKLLAQRMDAEVGYEAVPQGGACFWVQWQAC